MRGWVDEPLDSTGKIEVQLSAQKLRKYNPGFVYSSDFTRDTETANIVMNAMNISGYETDFDCRTWDVGAFSGKAETEVGQAIIELYKRPWEAPPGSSESFNTFSERWTGFLESRMQMVSQINTMRPTIIVTHGRNIALSQSYVEGINAWDCVMPYPAGFALLTVEMDRSLSIQFPTRTEPVVKDA